MNDAAKEKMNSLIQHWGLAIAVVTFAFWFGSSMSVTDEKLKNMSTILESVQKDVRELRTDFRENQCECNR